MGLSYGVAQILEVAQHHVGNTRTPHQALNGLRAVLILQNRTYDFNALVVHLQNAGMDYRWAHRSPILYPFTTTTSSLYAK